MQGMMGGHRSANLPKAQAIKDATMAYFISKNYMPDNKFIHFHGTYHSDNYEGILWYLKKAFTSTKLHYHFYSFSIRCFKTVRRK